MVIIKVITITTLFFITFGGRMATVYGYARISTKSQNIERQIRNILSFNPRAVLYSEAFTGTKITARPEWTRLKSRLKTGDTVVFDSVSRMSRNAAEGFALYKELYANGINLVFLKEPHINTDVYRKSLENQINVSVKSGDAATDRLMTSVIAALNEFALALVEKQILLAFEQSEKEVTDLHQRTKEGMITARNNGKQIGRAAGSTVETKKAKQAKAFIAKRNKTFGGDLSNEETWTLAGISKMSFYKYKNELIEKLNTDTQKKNAL